MLEEERRRGLVIVMSLYSTSNYTEQRMNGLLYIYVQSSSMKRREKDLLSIISIIMTTYGGGGC